jgi:hypothetical protein
VHRQQGTVLYDFTPEEEDEVTVMKGDKVEIEYEVAGWLQVSPGMLTVERDD